MLALTAAAAAPVEPPALLRAAGVEEPEWLEAADAMRARGLGPSKPASDSALTRRAVGEGGREGGRCVCKRVCELHTHQASGCDSYVPSNDAVGRLMRCGDAISCVVTLCRFCSWLGWCRCIV